MQIVFKTNQHPHDYAAPDPHDNTAEEKNFCGMYPDAPSKCPFKDCGIHGQMKKHGFYTRYLLTLIFAGKIRISAYSGIFEQWNGNYLNSCTQIFEQSYVFI